MSHLTCPYIAINAERRAKATGIQAADQRRQEALAIDASLPKRRTLDATDTVAK
jgi:hypothetical protein